MRADDRRGELAFARQHGQRRIGQQRIAGADAVDQPVDEAVDDEERIERLMVAVLAGQHALVAEFQDQRLALRRVIERSAASGRMPESWSPSANRASRSFGVIRSKPRNSVILPQRLATWLSATLYMPSGIASVRRRDGAAIEHAVAEIAEDQRLGLLGGDCLGEREHDLVGNRAVVERVDLQQPVAAGNDRVLVGGRPRLIDDRPALARRTCSGLRARNP